MSIVFTVQSEERVLCTSKPLIWEALQWGCCGVGERGQEIRIGVINNFCSVINQRHGIPQPPRYAPIFISSVLFFPLPVFSFILNVHFHLELHFFAASMLLELPLFLYIFFHGGLYQFMHFSMSYINNTISQ